MPNTLPGVEQFLSVAFATVTAGGNTAPAAGTQESWTISGSSLPTAQNTLFPNYGFYAADIVTPSEVVAIINISGATATVVRGADGTTPVPHSLPFVIRAIAAGASFGQLLPMWQPSHNGLLDATCPLDTTSGTNAFGAGIVGLTKIIPRFNYIVTNIWLFQTVTPVGASTGTFVGLYSQNGTRFGVSAECGASLVGQGAVSVPLITPQAVLSGVPYYVACLFNFATTNPTLRAANGSTATPNVNLSTANSRGAFTGSGLTALPATITMSAITPGQVNLIAVN